MSHLNFQILALSTNFVLLKVTYLVTLFDCKLQVFKNLPKLTIFSIFNELLSTQIVNVARFARNVECDFFFDFQTQCVSQKVLLIFSSVELFSLEISTAQLGYKKLRGPYYHTQQPNVAPLAAQNTVFENHRKSLIQHCEQSELRLHLSGQKFSKTAKTGQKVLPDAIQDKHWWKKPKIKCDLCGDFQTLCPKFSAYCNL